MVAYFTYRRLAVNLITVLLLVLFVTPYKVSAQSTDCSEKRLRDLGVTVVNCTGDTQKPTCSVGAPSPAASDVSSVYMIGDSITEGSLSQLTSAFTDAGITSVIDGKSSRSLSEGSTDLNGLTVIKRSSQSYVNADIVIIALGTNGGVTNTTISDTIASIKLVNDKASIYWVNLGVVAEYRDTPLNVDGWNEIIETNASLGYDVINWSEEVKNNPEYIDPDPSTGLGVHPIGEGRDAFANNIVNNIGSSSGSCSTNLTGGDNSEKAFNFFVSNGFTAEQAAGIVGNMTAESGVEPKRFQGYTIDELFSSEQVVAGTIPIKGGRAWGLVQWDPPTKMIVPSFDSGVAYLEIDTLQYQLKFLLEQLTGEGLGGTATNEKTAGDKVKTAVSVEDAAVFFGCYFERFQNSGTVSNGIRTCNTSNSEYSKRIALAVDVLTRYGS